MGLYGSAPESPDPKETAAAQTSTNVATATANSYLGNINQITPDGNLTYEYGQSKSIFDPTTGQTYQVPTTTVTTTLSPQQQAIKSQEDAAQLNLATLANTQSGKLNNILGTPFDLSGAPAAADISWLTMPQYQQFANAPALQGSVNSNGTIQNSIQGAGNIQSSLGNAGNIQGNIANAGNIQTGLGNAGKIQNGIANAGNITGQIANSGDITKTYGTDYSQNVAQVQDALMSRLNPSLQANRAALEQQLVNRGLDPGSTAYDRAYDAAMRQENDARLAVITQAGQEQSRLAALENQRASFENAAQAQQYAQNANNAGFANSAQAQRYQQNANDAAFANTAQQQAYQQMLASGQFANAAQGQQYQQNANNAAFSNAAQQQAYQQMLASGQFANAAQAQKFGQNQAQFDANNSAQQQSYAQGLSSAQLANSAAQQNYQNQNTTIAGNNALADQTFNAQQSLLNTQNQARANWLNEQYAARNQPINEIISLMSGAQIDKPNFVNAQGQSLPTVDYAGLVNQKYQNDLAAYNQQQAGIGSLLGGIGSLFSLSDKEAKTDIQKVGGLYSYRYKGEGKNAPKRIGVMAQEVEKIKPGVVRKGADGLRRVNYGALFSQGVQ